MDSDLAGSGSDVLITSSLPIATTIEARAFHAQTGAPVARIGRAITTDARIAPDRWPIGIASVARKTSVEVANVFSRAGVSLAQRF